MNYYICKSGNSGQPAAAKMLADDLVRKGIKLHRIEIRDTSNIAHRLFYVLYLFVLVKMIKRRSFFVIHANIEAMLMHLFRCKNVIFVNHGIKNFVFPESRSRKIMIWCLKRSVALGNTLYLVNKAQQCVVPNSRLLPNRIDTSGLVSRKLEERTIETFDNVGFVGRDDEQKNLAVLEGLIKKHKTKVFLHLAPSGIPAFSKAANYRHVPSHCRSDFFASIDLLLVPSKWESYGLVAREAQYCNIPVIHSGADGLSEFRFGINLESSEASVWGALNLDDISETDFNFSHCEDLEMETRDDAISEISDRISSFGNLSCL